MLAEQLFPAAAAYRPKSYITAQNGNCRKCGNKAVALQALTLYCTLEKQRGIYYAAIRDIARSKKRQTLPAGS